MNDHIHARTVPPLRAEPRVVAQPGRDGHVRGVEASAGGLLRATLGSALAAGAILVFFWLPAEYAIDPTGLGRAMGLTQMGEIKQQLYAEAAAEDAALAAQNVAPVAPQTDSRLAERLAAIEKQLGEIAAVVGASSALRSADPAAEAAAPEVNETETAALPGAAEPMETVFEPAATPAWRDVVSYTLDPGEGIEIKLAMQEGEVADFEWTANGSVLNHDTHGDGGGQKITYEQGRAVSEQQGQLTAAFSGNHGWFWRNRTDAPVTFTLRTRGEYSELRKP